MSVALAPKTSILFKYSTSSTCFLHLSRVQITAVDMITLLNPSAHRDLDWDEVTDGSLCLLQSLLSSSPVFWLYLSPSSLASLVVLGSCRPYSCPHLASHEAIRASACALAIVLSIAACSRLVRDCCNNLPHLASGKFHLSQYRHRRRSWPPSKFEVDRGRCVRSSFLLCPVLHGVLSRSPTLVAYPRIEAAARTI